MTRSVPFERPLAFAGWPASRWGFDPTLESYWAELCRTAAVDGGERRIEVGREHLITTIDGLARAIAHIGGIAPDDAYLALTA